MYKIQKQELTRQGKIDFLDELMQSGLFVVHSLLEYGLPRYLPTDSRSTSDIIDYIDDPLKYCANVYGVSIDDYQSWIEGNQAPTECSGVTKRGTLCKNTLLQSYPDKSTPSMWIRSKDSKHYCHLHGPVIIVNQDLVK